MGRRQWQPTPVLLPGKSRGRRSLVGCSPWGHEESDTTERLHFHFSLSCIGEGNGNPLQCSCLENPRDSGIWWAAVYGVAQSRTRLKRLSSSSSNPWWVFLGAHPFPTSLVLILPAFEMLCISLPAIQNRKFKYSFASLFKPANTFIYNEQEALDGTFPRTKAEVGDQRQSLHLKTQYCPPCLCWECHTKVCAWY